MEFIQSFISWFAENGMSFLGAFDLLLGALIAVCLLIPGDQPEKSFKVIQEFLGKFSRK